MNTPELQARLERLTTSQIKALAINAAVSERALWRIRSGGTLTASEKLKTAVMAHMPRARIQPKEKK